MDGTSLGYSPPSSYKCGEKKSGSATERNSIQTFTRSVSGARKLLGTSLPPPTGTKLSRGRQEFMAATATRNCLLLCSGRDEVGGGWWPWWRYETNARLGLVQAAEAAFQDSLPVMGGTRSKSQR
jgi:hypothetical protein